MINVIKKMKNIGMYAFLILVTFISVFPLYWMVSASTNKSVDVSKGVLSFGSHLGENLKKSAGKSRCRGCIGQFI